MLPSTDAWGNITNSGEQPISREGVLRILVLLFVGRVTCLIIQAVYCTITRGCGVILVHPPFTTEFITCRDSRSFINNS